MRFFVVDRSRIPVRLFFGGELTTHMTYLNEQRRAETRRCFIVDRARIELATHGFSGRCSTN